MKNTASKYFDINFPQISNNAYTMNGAARNKEIRAGLGINKKDAQCGNTIIPAAEGHHVRVSRMDVR